MTRGYIEFDTPEAFELWHQDVNAALGYPDAERGTERYTHLFRATDNKLYAKVDENCPADFLNHYDIIPFDDVELAEVIS